MNVFHKERSWENVYWHVFKNIKQFSKRTDGDVRMEEMCTKGFSRNNTRQRTPLNLHFTNFSKESKTNNELRCFVLNTTVVLLSLLLYSRNCRARQYYVKWTVCFESHRKLCLSIGLVFWFSLNGCKFY